MQAYGSAQQTTIASGTAETTIVTANPGTANLLSALIVTTPNTAVATLTLRESTGGAIKAVFDYPNAASAPSVPLIVTFNPPLQQPANSNWTIQASAAAAAIHITAQFEAQV